MLKIKKGDIVEAVKGKDKGKRGKVLAVYPALGKVLVEGVNLVKKHKRQNRQDEPGGIISVERPLSVANVALFCKNCNRPVRAGFQLDKEGNKTRICKRCKEVI